MALFDQISEDIKSAMKARDKVRLETLRNIKKVFLEAKTAPGANDSLADADALKIISKLAKQGKETAATYTQAGRQDLADAELAQVEVLESYLPKQLSQEEIEAEVKKIIAEVGATSMKEMGKVMGTASKQLAGKADGRVISEIVKKAPCIKIVGFSFRISVKIIKRGVSACTPGNSLTRYSPNRTCCPRAISHLPQGISTWSGMPWWTSSNAATPTWITTSLRG